MTHSHQNQTTVQCKSMFPGFVFQGKQLKCLCTRIQKDQFRNNSQNLYIKKIQINTYIHTCIQGNYMTVYIETLFRKENSAIYHMACLGLGEMN